MPFPVSQSWDIPIVAEDALRTAPTALLDNAEHAMRRLGGFDVERAGDEVRMRMRFGLAKGPAFVNVLDRFTLAVAPDTPSPVLRLTVTHHHVLVLDALIALAFIAFQRQGITLPWNAGIALFIWACLVVAHWLWAGIWPRSLLRNPTVFAAPTD